MKLVYINNILLPSEYAHSVQVMKMCESFADKNVNVTLLVPNRKNRIKISAHDYYNIKSNFRIIKLPCIDFFYEDGSKIMYWVRFISFYVSAKVYLLLNSFDIIYTRDLYAALFFNNFYYEMHDFPKNSFILRKLVKKTKKIFTTNNWKKQSLIKVYPEYEKKIEVVPNATDANFLNDTSIVKEIKDKFVIGYFGSLKTKGMDKGITDLLLSVKFMSHEFLMYIVGGEATDVEFYREKAKEYNVFDKVFFRGRLPYKDVIKFMRGCDVLIAPFPENEHYSFYMSPLKIFEYMASKRPIIATDLPSIREVLINNENAILVKPGDPKALAEAIIKLKENPELGRKLADRAYKDVVSKYTWKKRAENILKFIKK